MLAHGAHVDLDVPAGHRGEDRHIGDHWAARKQMKAIRPESYGFGSQHFVATRRPKGEAPHVDAFVQELKRQ